MQKITQLLLKAPLLTVAVVCFVIAAVIFVFFNTEETTVKGTAQKQQETPTKILAPTEEEEVIGAQISQSTNVVISPTVTVAVVNPTNTLQLQQAAATQTPEPTHSASFGNAQDKSSGQASEKKTFQVNLLINGSSVGNVAMEEGNNQCDVLSHAKDQGKISQLLMKYDNGLGTNGVYQINDVGKENVVWWTYKVNGASPTQGCSHLKANSGDTVEWEYKG